jgi:hypothetical protein
MSSKKAIAIGVMAGLMGSAALASNVFAIAATGLLGTLSGPIMQPLVAMGCSHTCHESEIFPDVVAHNAGLLKAPVSGQASQEALLKALLGQAH